jgi:hypothetical protein
MKVIKTLKTDYNTITIAIAKDVRDAGIVGVHLLNPNKIEVQQAVERAYSHGFNTIIIHTEKTFFKY